MEDKVQVQVSVRTREALRNLFGILGIVGPTFDDRLFELATRAFAGQCKAVDPLRHRVDGRGRVPRRQIEIKGTTFEELQELFPQLYPYLEWQSWDWYMQELTKLGYGTLGPDKTMELLRYDDED